MPRAMRGSRFTRRGRRKATKNSANIRPIRTAPTRPTRILTARTLRQEPPLALSLRADLRVPLPQRSHVRALPVDDGARAREVRRLRRRAGRARPLSRRDPLQGIGLLLDRLRQGEVVEGRRGLVAGAGHEEDRIEAGREEGRVFGRLVYLNG